MVTEIVDDVYDITVAERNGGRYRVYLVDCETPTLVDAGFEDTTDAVAEGVEAVGVEPERIALTHSDADHMGGLASLAERYDAETWVPQQTRCEEFRPDERYGDDSDIGPFTAVHVPGHTSDHHALVAESRSFAVLGDAVFGSDVRGIPTGHFVLPPAVFTEDLAAAEENLERLTGYEFETGLLYHGANVTEGASEKLSSFVDFSGKP